jgi:predicted DNA-binding protein
MALESVKPTASLSAGLLARKGGARPGQKYMAEPGLEIPERNCVIRFGASDVTETIVTAPAPDFYEPFADNDLPAEHDDIVHIAPAQVQPLVVHQAPVFHQAPVAFDMHPVDAARPEPQPVEARQHAVATAQAVESKPRRAAGSGSKAAFTLRLDAERHLRLRLLSAHQHRSAQRIVLEAVDRLLAEMFEPLLASGRLIATAANEQAA